MCIPSTCSPVWSRHHNISQTTKTSGAKHLHRSDYTVNYHFLELLKILFYHNNIKLRSCIIPIFNNEIIKDNNYATYNINILLARNTQFDSYFRFTVQVRFLWVSNERINTQTRLLTKNLESKVRRKRKIPTK